MRELIVGSTALSYFGLNRLKPKDIDVWTDNTFMLLGKYNKADVKCHPERIIKLIPQINGYATADAIYNIKMSHFSWDIHWDKTKADILWLSSKRCKLNKDLYLKLNNYWAIEHGDKSFLSLKKNKKDFFDDNVKYVYDHDYLHELVAYPNEPLYKSCLKNGEDILIDKNKFEMMPFDDKVKMFREEICTIAAERWLINPVNKGKYSWVQAYNLALKKTIISLTKNWATDFIIWNLKYFVKPEYNYFKYLISILKL